MSAVLRSIIDHHIWANDTLLTFCEGLSDEQLAQSGPGTYGPVHKTLVHIAEAEQTYLSRIPDSGIVRTVDDEAANLPPVPEIRTALRETGAAWRRVVEWWPDDTPISYRTGEGEQECRSISFSVAQVLDHGAEHRNHVRTILSTHGIEPPEIDGWSWDDERQSAGSGEG